MLSRHVDPKYTRDLQEAVTIFAEIANEVIREENDGVVLKEESVEGLGRMDDERLEEVRKSARKMIEHVESEMANREQHREEVNR